MPTGKKVCHGNKAVAIRKKVDGNIFLTGHHSLIWTNKQNKYVNDIVLKARAL